MNIIAEIGVKDSTIVYTDRPTVKVIIRKNDNVLVLSDGLLPGGGVDSGETDFQAIKRELSEELGATVTNITAIGTVVQYRQFLKKRYVIHGYTADLVSFDGNSDPQDNGEAQFTYHWLPKQEALSRITDSIKAYNNIAIQDDAQQGRLFNRKSSLELLLALK